MTPSPRHSSLDPVQIEGWRWQPFLDDAVGKLQGLDPQPYDVPERFLLKQGSTGSKARPVPVTTATWACSTAKLRQVRSACVEAGAAASVLNFVINPSCRYDLPFFGADLVTLPNGHLLALDLQPVDKSDPEHTEPVWERLMPIFDRWRQELPDGGPIPEEAQPYFSPAFLWTRQPWRRRRTCWNSCRRGLEKTSDRDGEKAGRLSRPVVCNSREVSQGSPKAVHNV
jgi:phycoerythrobilin:ferredoxin oxidoreductase